MQLSTARFTYVQAALYRVGGHSLTSLPFILFPTFPTSLSYPQNSYKDSYDPFQLSYQNSKIRKY